MATGGVETAAGGSGLRETTTSSPEEEDEIASETEALQCWRLDLLPNDILLNIMCLLDTTSVILLSRVCKRFYDLHGDPSVWRDVHLTDKPTENVGQIMCSNNIMNIMTKYLGPYTWRVNVSFWLKRQGDGVLFEDLFARCPNIRSITLQGSSFDIQTTQDKFWHCQSLEEVVLNACHLPMGWGKEVKPTWPRLTQLRLDRCINITDGDLEYLASCQDTATSLRVLDLRFDFNPRLTNAAMKCVSTSMPNLHTLILDGCTGMTEKVMEDIHRLKHLQHLDFGPHLSESGYFRLLKLFPSLVSLHVELNDESVLQSVEDSAATIAYRNSGVELHLYVEYDMDTPSPPSELYYGSDSSYKMWERYSGISDYNDDW